MGAYMGKADRPSDLYPGAVFRAGPTRGEADVLGRLLEMAPPGRLHGPKA